MATNNAINSLNPIQVALGGTGAATLTAHGVLLGEGTGAVTPTAVGTNGQILVGTSAADPTWVTPTAGSNLTVTANATTHSYALNASPSVSGSLTAGTTITATSGAITATAGDIVITSGNILLPTTSSTVGNIKFNNVTYIHAFGTNSLFLGNLAGNYTYTGTGQHVAVGTSALSALTSAVQNTAIGYQALKAATSGADNTVVGFNAGLAITTSSENVAIGESSLSALTTGSGNNTVVGSSALASLGTGANNVAIGVTAGFNLTGTDSQNISIGQNRGVAGDNTTTRIGFTTTNTSVINRCFIDGIRGITTTAVDALPVLVSSTGQLGTVSSSIRFKDNIQDMADDSSPLMELRPVTFNYKSHPGKKSFGLIAEEVLPVMPELVVYNTDGEVESVKYQDIAIMLLNEVQKLTKRIEALESK